MEGVSVEEMSGWRNRMSRQLQERGHSVRNPVKGEHTGLNVKRMTPSKASSVVSEDKEDIMQSHALIVKITSLGRAYWGTAMEMMFASEVLEKPLLVICPQDFDSVRSHPWLIEHVDAWYDSEEALLSAIDEDNLPKSAFGEVRLAPIGYVDVSSDSLGEVDINEWVSDKVATLGQGQPIRVLACMKVGPSPVVTEAN
jgi:hypothetical protein